MREKIKQLLKKKWYFQGFNGTPALLYGSTKSTVHHMPKTLGYGYEGIIEFFEGDKCYYLYGWDDLFSILKILRLKVRKDRNYLDFLLKKDEEIVKNVLSFYKELDGMDISKMPDNQLYELYRKTDDKYGSILSVSHIVETFTLTTEDNIRRLVEKHFKENSREMLVILTAPLWHSFMSVEHNDLYKISRDIKKLNLRNIGKEALARYPAVYKKIESHQKRYFWKNNGYASAKILTVDDFIKEINEILKKDIDIDKKIKEFEGLRNNKKNKEAILNKIDDQELKELISINDVIFRLHDHRKELMTMSMHYIDMFLKEVGRRKNIPLNLMRYIKAEEISEVSSLKDELKERRKRSVFITIPEGTYVYTGKEADEYISELNAQRRIEETSVIKGNCASKGIAVGIVKVCRGEEEISKMKEGNILVACMTQPEFGPAMKKAKAIITDEGGLTCHAAIVSRELGIPCIIGTRIATKVLKDGMKVEVDADKGIVKIL